MVNLKTWLKRAAGAIVFLAILAAMVLRLDSALKLIQEDNLCGRYYDYPDDTFDVTFLGSSFALYAIYPMELYRDFGIASYNMATGNQSIEASYYLAKESIEKDACGRLAGVKEDIDFMLEREELACKLQSLKEAGELPLRVSHNDTKLNNVLLDKDTRKCLCVLDLDTVMPGLSLYDYGDSIRFGAATAAEDEHDVSKMQLDLHLFRVYTRGYLQAAPSLTPLEVEMMPMGALIMTLEVGIRFLKDYLDGDLYFSKIAYPEHNLVRARSQMALVADMEKKWTQMNLIVAKVADEIRR
jgi:hypothetical protein